ncbi:hypothetical protein HQN88_05365 [Paenibacillus qinlingensis]|nr:hypothetical protein [Paenibacillus qinlingensis]
MDFMQVNIEFFEETDGEPVVNFDHFIRFEQKRQFQLHVLQLNPNPEVISLI